MEAIAKKKNSEQKSKSSYLQIAKQKADQNYITFQ